MGTNLLPQASAAEKRKITEEEAKWRAQEDLRALRAAEEIKKDPSRIAKIQSLIDEEMNALKSVKLPKRA